MKTPQPAQGPLNSELLVSVRSLAEAEVAAALSVDILDFKEPLNGPLAPVDRSLWQAAAARFRTGNDETSIPLSAALGERDSAPHVASAVPASFAFAKAGPHACRTSRELTDLWSDVRSALSERVELVAVAYADSNAADSLVPEEVIKLAQREGFQRVLIDTFVKDSRSSVEHLTVERLREIRSLASQFGLRLMLAGAIREQDLDDWLDDQTRPDGFGVRGDVCRSGRISEIDPERIRVWRRRLAGSQLTQPNPNRSFA